MLRFIMFKVSILLVLMSILGGLSHARDRDVFPRHIETRTAIIFAKYNVALQGSELSAPDLLNQVCCQNTEINRACIYSLGEIRCSEAVAALLPVLDARDEVVARMAASALGKIGAEDAVAALAVLAADEEAPAMLRVSAIRALGRIGGPAARRCIAPLAAHQRTIIRRNADYALATYPLH